MLKARLITPLGSFASRYYAIAILYGNYEITLQCPASCYPSAPEDEDTEIQEGLNTTAKSFFEEIIEAINNPERAVYEKHMDEIDQANQQYEDK